MTIFEWQANTSERSAGFLAHFVKTTDPDWIDKCPAVDEKSKTRSILDQLAECVTVNRRAAAALSGKALPEEELKFVDVDDACSQLVASAKEYGSVVRGLDESVMEKSFDVGFGPRPGSFFLMMPASNMMYHCGQVNYVQLLSGDDEFHIPPSV